MRANVVPYLASPLALRSSSRAFTVATIGSLVGAQDPVGEQSVDDGGREHSVDESDKPGHVVSFPGGIGRLALSRSW